MSAASLTVLGCDGGYPGPGGAGSGYLVRVAGMTICLDMGPGVLARLQLEVPLAALDAVIISHEHPDHRADLDQLAVALHFAEPPLRIPVLAPAGIREQMYFSEWEELRWQTVADGDDAALGAVEVAFSRTDHGPETLALHLTAGGGTLVYSADTGESPATVSPTGRRRPAERYQRANFATAEDHAWRSSASVSAAAALAARSTSAATAAAPETSRASQ